MGALPRCRNYRFKFRQKCKQQCSPISIILAVDVVPVSWTKVPVSNASPIARLWRWLLADLHLYMYVSQTECIRLLLTSPHPYPPFSPCHHPSASKLFHNNWHVNHYNWQVNHDNCWNRIIVCYFIPPVNVCCCFGAPWPLRWYQKWHMHYVFAGIFSAHAL